jgi:agmatinase
MEICWVKSPFLSILKKGNGFILADGISQKQFSANENVIQLLELFSSPKSLHDIKTLIDNIPNGDLCFKFLEENHLVIKSDNIHIQNRVSLTNTRIFDLPEFNPKVDRHKIVFIGIPYGGGNHSSDDTKNFPLSIRQFTKSRNIFFKRSEKIDSNFLIDVNLNAHLKELRICDWGNIFIHPYEAPENIYEKIFKITCDVLSLDCIPFYLGGDHSVTYPILRAFDGAKKELSVIHIDAHTDTYRTDYEPLLKNGVHHHGNFMSHALKLPNIIKCFQFGIRGVSNMYTPTENKISRYWVDDVRELLNCDSTFDFLNPYDNYYLTIDIDVLDPSIAEATPTPVPNGLSIKELTILLERIIKGRKIIGVDLVEISPKLDIVKNTTQIAVNTLIQILNEIK